MTRIIVRIGVAVHVVHVRAVGQEDAYHVALAALCTPLCRVQEESSPEAACIFDGFWRKVRVRVAAVFQPSLNMASVALSRRFEHIGRHPGLCHGNTRGCSAGLHAGLHGRYLGAPPRPGSCLGETVEHTGRATCALANVRVLPAALAQPKPAKDGPPGSPATQETMRR